MAFAITSVAFAQTEKGNWLVGSDFGLSYSTSTNKTEPSVLNTKTTTNTFKVTPNLNYFVMDNLALGLGLSYQSTTTKEERNVGGISTSFEGKSNVFSIVPNATYFIPLGSIAPFVGAGVGYASASYGDNDAQKSSGLTFNAKGGVAYFVNSGVAITGTLGYDYLSLTNKKDKNIKEKVGTFGVGIGVAMFF